jgi:glycosyltransferase involved in cell wall biosynthesis
LAIGMRIALLVDPLAVRLRGGEHPRELAAALAERGHEVRTFGGGGGAPDDRGQATQEGSPEGRRVLDFEPEGVVAYEPLSPAAWLGSRIARRRDVPLVLVEPGPLPGSRWLERALLRAGQSLWGRYVRSTAHRVVVLDPLARERALARGFLPERIALVPHGVDPRRFRPGLSSPLIARHRIAGRILLHPGGCDPGAEVLIAAFAQTVGRRGDWALVLARAGKPARLRAAADRAGIGASVHVLQAGEEDLPSLFSSSTLVALPDLADGPGLPLQRAYACGKPVLASDHPGLRFVFERAGAGLMAPPGDVAAWTDALRLAAASPEARARWGRAALAAAREAFAWSTIAAAFEQALRSVRPAPAAGAPAEAGEPEEGRPRVRRA